MLEQWSLILSWDYQPVTISDDLWLAVFFFNFTNTLLREGLNSIYSRAPQFRTPGASALHTLRNKYSSSFRKGSTRHDLRIRPARRLKLRALHSHPHFPFLVSSPRSPYPLARLWGHASPTLRLGARGPGRARTAGVVPATPWAAGAVATSAEHRGKSAAATPNRLPFTSPGTKGSDPNSRLTSRPEAGRRKPRLSQPAHRPALARIRPEEVAGPVSGCAIAVWVPGKRGGWGGAWVSGDRQVRPLEVSGGARLVSGPKPESRASCLRRGWAPVSGSRSGSAEDPLLLPPRSSGEQPLPCGSLAKGGGPWWVRSVTPGNSDQGTAAKKGVGPHKPPRAKVKVTPSDS